MTRRIRYLIRPTSPVSAVDHDVPADLRSDARVTIVAEMPGLLLIDCPEKVAEEWQDRIPGWKMQPERRVRVPDPRPKVK